MSLPAPQPPPQRRAYRRAEVRALYGASFSAIDRAIRKGDIAVKTYGRSVFLSVADVERLFGPDEQLAETTGVSQRTLDEIGDLLP